MWNFGGNIEFECSECGERYNIPVKEFETDCIGSYDNDNGMGMESLYRIAHTVQCDSCSNEMQPCFEALEYPEGMLSNVIEYSSGCVCFSEPTIEHSPDYEDLIYILPKQDIFVPDQEICIPKARIITDLSILEQRIPRLIQYLSENPREIYKLEPREFEEIVAEIFRENGFDVELTKRTRDGGKDIVAIQRHHMGISTKYFIECKKYAEKNKIGVDLIRNLQGVKNTKDGPNKMILATTSYFTKDALNFSKEEAHSMWDLSLHDYEDIIKWIRDYANRKR